MSSRQIGTIAAVAYLCDLRVKEASVPGKWAPCNLVPNVRAHEFGSFCHAVLLILMVTLGLPIRSAFPLKRDESFVRRVTFHCLFPSWHSCLRILSRGQRSTHGTGKIKLASGRVIVVCPDSAPPGRHLPYQLLES
ncbi:hypothetical protein Bcep18194_B1031 [Burkholderia lata]|uniref:Uncharacterized protein n=1 Tax=Burkholderia lata (strain ATCC 17760 / DSM 23089 / LMG 22485 / NCIMB 9086 / R18194 / 383) TaxID=482957 RepID=Q398G6_BURL3|nr:hypothetical protein Bcep18194_B1031 [Burkholderia lata]